jgi:membrane protein
VEKQTPEKQLDLSIIIRMVTAYALLASVVSHVPEKAPKAGGNGDSVASSPKAIAPRTWLEIAKGVWARIGKDRVIAVAAGFTFYALLAIFPAITATVSVYGLFADTSSIERSLTSLSSLLPAGAIDVISDQIKRIVAQGKGTLSFAFGLSLATAIWSANAGMKAMFDALNVAYERKETRSFIVLNSLSLAFTAATLFFTCIALASIVAVPIFLANSIAVTSAAVLFTAASWIVLLVFIVLGLAFLYRYGPAQRTTAWQWVTPGSIFASIAWVIVSVAFSWYAKNFASYNETYGALGAVIGFMTWMWISAIVILIGAEVNAEAEEKASGAPSAAEESGRGK